MIWEKTPVQVGDRHNEKPDTYPVQHAAEVWLGIEIQPDSDHTGEGQQLRLGQA